MGKPFSKKRYERVNESDLFPAYIVKQPRPSNEPPERLRSDEHAEGVGALGCEVYLLVV